MLCPARWRRLVQIALPAAAVFLVGSLNDLVMAGRADAVYALPFLAAAAGMTIAGLRYPVGWTISYKGHRISFNVHPVTTTSIRWSRA